MKILVAGGTGLIGQSLTSALQQRGHALVVLTRGSRGAIERLPTGVRALRWNDAWPTEVRGANAIVNLAGASIGGGRWTEARKRVLIDSRVQSNQALVRALAATPAAERPQALITASGVDYYGHHPGDEHLDERAPAGTSFLARLCVAWEAAALDAEPLGVRVAQMRTGFCVGRGAPALRLLALPFRLFVGGPLGTGRQWFTWIHLDDLVNLYVLAIENDAVRGPINAVAPHVPREREVAGAIGRVLHRPSWAPAPEFMLRLVLGDMADLLLHGRKAVPAAAEATGYQFRYPALPAALQEALKPPRPT
jgi:uncharacterized protein (TIGR01777 family)